jgi:hypothetical protein
MLIHLLLAHALAPAGQRLAPMWYLPGATKVERWATWGCKRSWLIRLMIRQVEHKGRTNGPAADALIQVKAHLTPFRYQDRGSGVA